MSSPGRMINVRSVLFNLFIGELIFIHIKIEIIFWCYMTKNIIIKRSIEFLTKNFVTPIIVKRLITINVARDISWDFSGMTFYILTRAAVAKYFPCSAPRGRVWKISKLFKINDASWPIPRDRILNDMNVHAPLSSLSFLIQKQ